MTTIIRGTAVKLHMLDGGGCTATWGAWILARRMRDGRIVTISHDAPADVLQLARDLLAAEMRS